MTLGMTFQSVEFLFHFAHERQSNPTRRAYTERLGIVLKLYLVRIFHLSEACEHILVLFDAVYELDDVEVDTAVTTQQRRRTLNDVDVCGDSLSLADQRGLEVAKNWEWFPVDTSQRLICG